MIKKIITILLLLILVYIIVMSTENFSNANDYRFTYLDGTEASAKIIIDNQTKVMYLFYGENYKGGLTVLVDKDGKPLIYEEK